MADIIYKFFCKKDYGDQFKNGEYYKAKFIKIEFGDSVGYAYKFFDSLGNVQRFLLKLESRVDDVKDKKLPSFKEYFYTLKEEREIKIKKLNEKEK